MKSTKLLFSVLSLSLLGVPALASAKQADTPPAHSAPQAQSHAKGKQAKGKQAKGKRGKKGKAQKHAAHAQQREQRRSKALASAGVEGARAQQALDVLKRGDTKRAAARKELRTGKRALGRLLKQGGATEQAFQKALDSIRAAKKKMAAARDATHVELGKVLKPSEQARFYAELRKGNKNRAGHPGNRGKGPRGEQARSSHGAVASAETPLQRVPPLRAIEH